MKDFTEQIKYWRVSAQRDFKTAEMLLKNKRYDACLFFCHLAIEKILKGLVVQNIREVPPYTHDPFILLKTAGIGIAEEYKEDLEEITTFNIAGRYDTHKFSFYKKCTPSFTNKYFVRSKDIFLWLKKQYRKR